MFTNYKKTRSVVTPDLTWALVVAICQQLFVCLFNIQFNLSAASLVQHGIKFFNGFHMFQKPIQQSQFYL